LTTGETAGESFAHDGESGEDGDDSGAGEQRVVIVPGSTQDAEQQQRPESGGHPHSAE
jgi:hypothetical protein